MKNWSWGQSRSGIIQMAYIVEDIRTAMPAFTRDLGVGPWFVIEHFPFDRLSYRGAPSNIDITLCLGASGGMMYELIQQNDDNPSVYQEVRDARGWGFHHYAVGVEPSGYDALLKDHVARGAEIVLDAQVGVGARAAYVDTRAELHGMIEVIEMTSGVEELFGGIHAASLNWDGSDPIRTLG
ncbi:VOC family protein [Brevundimonas sp.]|uniref:VOC family protein n=1 Tax=Brevundimonas sp. TaxID=1871086 RepID=UPI003BADA07F